MLSLLFTLPQFIIVVLALFQRSKLSTGVKFMALQALVSCFADMMAFCCIRFWGISNEFIYNFYMIAEFVIIALAFRSAINSVSIQRAIRISIIAFPVFAVLIFGLTSFMSLNYQVLALSFLVLSVINLVYLILPDIRLNSSDGLILVAIGHIIYFLGVTPYFIGRELMIQSQPEKANELFVYINLVLAICRYLFIILGFLSLSLRKKPEAKS